MYICVYIVFSFFLLFKMEWKKKPKEMKLMEVKTCGQILLKNTATQLIFYQNEINNLTIQIS